MINSKGWNVTGNDRIQIGLSNGYDSKIIEQWLKLCPIELIITESTQDGFSAIIHTPPGIVVTRLGESESRKAYFVDIDDDIYSRLQLPRRKSTSIRFSISTSISDIVLLNSEPIVIKPFRDDLIIIGATKVWDIQRGQKSDDMIPSDPFTIPEPLKRLTAIGNEDFPQDNEDLVFFRRRLNNALDVFNWYNRNILSNKVREFVRFSTAMLNDKIQECSRLERKLKRLPEWNAVYLDSLFSQLSGHVDQATLNAIKLQATAKADLALNEHAAQRDAFLGNNDQVDVTKFVGMFSENKAYNRCKSVLAIIDKHQLPLHNCKFCSSDAHYIRGSRVDASGATVEIWHVKCSGCKNTLSRDKWNKFQASVGLQWNKENEGDYPVSEAPGFEFSGMDIKDISSRLKDFNLLLSKVSVAARNAYKDDPSIDSSDAEVKFANALAWAGYIGHCIKQINIKARGVSRNT